MSIPQMGGEFPGYADAVVGEYRTGRWRDVREACALMIESPDWRRDQGERGKRRMPTLWQIASYWASRGDFSFGLSESMPKCAACNWFWFKAEGGTPEEKWNSASRYLERGHIVNWTAGGLDGVQNLVPLCRFCNMAMPVFRPEEWPAAVIWIEDGGPVLQIEDRLREAGVMPESIFGWPSIWPPPRKHHKELARLIRLTYPEDPAPRPGEPAAAAMVQLPPEPAASRLRRRKAMAGQDTLF